jgi:flagellar protein FliS
MYTNTAVAHAAYQSGQVHAAGPVRIVVLLYDGAIRFARKALTHFDEVSIRGEALGRSHAIVTELLGALDAEKGGEIAYNLARLYEFVLDRLIQANVRGDRKGLAGAISVMETLASSWREIDTAPMVQRSHP